MAFARIGEPAFEFNLPCVDAHADWRTTVRRSDYAGRWLILIFYPRDFSFVCPTELTAFSARLPDFKSRGCELLGISVDPIELHREWLSTPVAEGGLGPLQFPLASDPDGTAARQFGVWIEEKEVSTRGLFIIDPEGVLQYAVVHNLSVGRNPDEVLRVLEALRTGGLCPVSWTAADGTIDPERELRPGRILGHYRILRKLGSGTFGTVFAAWDLRLERPVALKVLRRSIFESREALLREARAAARLNHPNVCTIYAVEEDDGLPVIAMEYLDGQPLSEAIDSLKRDAVGPIVGQIASALSAAHAEDIVHGDLKPANVILTGQGMAKVLDFGLALSKTPAKSLSAGEAKEAVAAALDALAEAETEATIDHCRSDSREPTGIRGTPAYMSPEQASGLASTPASDVFSLGLTLLEMLTGRRALSDSLAIDILLRLQTEELGPQLVAHVDEPYRELLLAMLARDAAARPSIMEVARQLAAIAEASAR